MTNKEILESKMKDTDYKLGCYDEDIEKLSMAELNKVIERMFDDYTDVEVKIRRKEYVVEIATVDNEIDFKMISKLEYSEQYGRNVGE